MGKVFSWEFLLVYAIEIISDISINKISWLYPSFILHRWFQRHLNFSDPPNCWLAGCKNLVKLPNQLNDVTKITRMRVDVRGSLWNLRIGGLTGVLLDRIVWNEIFTLWNHRTINKELLNHICLFLATYIKDKGFIAFHDNVIKWKHFPRNWPFVRGIHRGPVNSPHKGQWRGALMFSLICVWINDWVNNREPDDLRRYRAHYNVKYCHALKRRGTHKWGLSRVSYHVITFIITWYAVLVACISLYTEHGVIHWTPEIYHLWSPHHLITAINA